MKLVSFKPCFMFSDFSGGGSGGFGLGGQGNIDLNFGPFTGTFLQGLQALGKSIKTLLVIRDTI